MTIVQYVASIVAAYSPAPSFIHGWKSWQNLVADKTKLPLVFLDEPITSNDDLKKSGYIEPSYPLTLLFLDKSQLDWKPAQHQVVINAQRLKAREFITRLSNDDKTVYDIKNISRTDVINIMDCNMSGCLLKLEFKIYDETAICL